MTPSRLSSTRRCVTVDKDNGNARLTQVNGRTPLEWIGATPDTPIPPRVKLRVFLRHGRRCYLTGRKIRPGDSWDCDHVVALCNGGQNRESNLAPALRDKHREKTAGDVATKSRDRKIAGRHAGVRKSKSLVYGWRKFDGTPVRNPRLREGT